jgi:hypothetical protein
MPTQLSHEEDQSWHCHCSKFQAASSMILICAWATACQSCSKTLSLSPINIPIGEIKPLLCKSCYSFSKARLHPPLSAQAAAPCTHFNKTENRKRREGLAIAAIRRQHERRKRTAAKAFNSWEKKMQEKAIKARSKPGDQSPQARHEKDKCTEEMLRYTAM